MQEHCSLKLTLLHLNFFIINSWSAAKVQYLEFYSVRPQSVWHIERMKNLAWLEVKRLIKYGETQWTGAILLKFIQMPDCQNKESL